MAANFDVGMKCIKYMLFIANFMFVIVGFLLISIGSTINAIYDDFETFMESHHFSPAAILIAVGVITFLVAIFGCLGAIRESTMLVNLYSLMLCLILILEVSAAIAAYTMRSDINETIKNNMVGSMGDYDVDETATDSWDFMQDKLQCCGVNDVKDWKVVPINGSEVTIEGDVLQIPSSCCSYPNCETFYERGCLDRLSYIVSECAFMLGTGAICVALVQVLGIAFAHMLAKAIRNVKTTAETRRQQNLELFYDQLRAQPVDEKVRPVIYTPLSSDA